MRSFGTVKRGRSSWATRSSCRSSRPERISSLSIRRCVSKPISKRGRGSARLPGYSPLQIVVELLRDQSFFEQGLIPAHLLPQRRLAQEPFFQSRHVVGVLPTKRIQGVAHFFAAMLDDFAGDLGQTLSENGAQTLGVEADQPLDQQARHQQQFDPISQPIGKEPLNSEMPVKEIGDAECRRKRRAPASAALWYPRRPSERAPSTRASAFRSNT